VACFNILFRNLPGKFRILIACYRSLNHTEWYASGSWKTNSMKQSPSWESRILKTELVKKFSALCGNQRVITVFIIAHYSRHCVIFSNK